MFEERCVVKRSTPAYCREVRIIAGRFGGRRLNTPTGRNTRPTADRVREAVFSILGDVSNFRVLDAFAGTGSLGLEALSRGATHCVFIERQSPAVRLLTANIRDVGVEGQTKVYRDDTFVQLRRLSTPFDLVFLDPPYAKNLWGKSLCALDRQTLVSEGGRVVCEHPSSASISLPPGWKFEDRRKYGDVSISIVGKDHA